MPQAQKLNVLVVDDDPMISKMLQSALSAHGHTVMARESGSGAIKALLEHSFTEPFDLVICDINMPGKSGFTTISETKNLDHRAKVLAITAGGTIRGNDILTMTKNTAADAVLTKPFSADDLIAEIDKLFG